MTRAAELIAAVEAQGGTFFEDHDRLIVDPKRAAEPFASELREHKAEVAVLPEPDEPDDDETDDEEGNEEEGEESDDD